MILKIIRWIYGYVKFGVRGGNVERFINMSVRVRINFWDVHRSKDALYGKVIAKDYIQLHNIARKTKSKIRVKKRYGLPFIENRYRFRIGFFLGILMYIGIIYVLSLYVWNVRVTGNENVPQEEILRTMSELGLSNGTLKSHIDVPMIKQYGMIKLPNMSWISVNLKGSTAEVCVKEKTDVPKRVDEDRPCNIKAGFDGQIERIETYKGTCVVNVGEAVVKGQLLINGAVEDYFGRSSLVHAQGKIFAKTQRKVQEEIVTSKTESVDTGKVIKRYKVKVFGVEVPFRLWENTDDNYRLEIDNFRLNFFGVNLPFSVYSERWYEQTCEYREIDYEQAKKYSIDKINTKFVSDNKDIQILSQENIEFEENGHKFVEIKYNCIEDIGNKEEIFFE